MGGSKSTVTPSPQSITTIDLPLSQTFKPWQLNDQWGKTLNSTSEGSSKERANGLWIPVALHSAVSDETFLINLFWIFHFEYKDIYDGSEKIWFPDMNRDKSRKNEMHQEVIEKEEKGLDCEVCRVQRSWRECCHLLYNTMRRANNGEDGRRLKSKAELRIFTMTQACSFFLLQWSYSLSRNMNVVYTENC